ncbi:MAG: AAA family ATPase [Oscillospiraceae bacterium]|nr:AAA family ATPase [Oscillospiraceae bacterium]
MREIYFIGGSPCCGKSTIAEKISEKYGFLYYKADDFLTEFIEKGGADGHEWLKYVSEMSLDQLWLRAPEILNDEALLIYEKLFPYFINGLNKLDADTPIITEGAAFAPSLVYKAGVDKTHYVCLVPTKEFQIRHYSKRLWVKDYLELCSDKDKAFSNWMERDVLFALSVLSQAKEIGYAAFVVDGAKSIDESYQFVINAFSL